jgi:RNA polymerase sigma factor (sigma-70 family)
MVGKDLKATGVLVDAALWYRAAALLEAHGRSTRRDLPPTEENDLDKLCVEALTLFGRVKDERLFDLVVSLCLPFLSDLTRRLARDRRHLSPDELIHDTLLSIYTHLGQFRPSGRSPFFRWITVIARNHAKMRERARVRRLKHERKASVREGSHADDPLTRLLGWEKAQFDAKVTSHLIRRIEVIKAGLPEDTRTCLRLAAEGIPYKEIGTSLNLTMGAVTMRIKRARASIVKALVSEGHDLSAFLKKRAAPQETAMRLSGGER